MSIGFAVVATRDVVLGVRPLAFGLAGFGGAAVAFGAGGRLRGAILLLVARQGPCPSGRTETTFTFFGAGMPTPKP